MTIEMSGTILDTQGWLASILVMPCLQIVQMNNYCGIGIDAELSLDFHQAREEEPGKFTSRYQ